MNVNQYTQSFQWHKKKIIYLQMQFSKLLKLRERHQDKTFFKTSWKKKKKLDVIKYSDDINK